MGKEPLTSWHRVYGKKRGSDGGNGAVGVEYIYYQRRLNVMTLRDGNFIWRNWISCPDAGHSGLRSLP